MSLINIILLLRIKIKLLEQNHVTLLLITRDKKRALRLFFIYIRY